jgi:hypothetical protein
MSAPIRHDRIDSNGKLTLRHTAVYTTSGWGVATPAPTS